MSWSKSDKHLLWDDICIPIEKIKYLRVVKDSEVSAFKIIAEFLNSETLAYSTNFRDKEAAIETMREMFK